MTSLKRPHHSLSIRVIQFLIKIKSITNKQFLPTRTEITPKYVFEFTFLIAYAMSVFVAAVER